MWRRATVRLAASRGELETARKEMGELRGTLLLRYAEAENQRKTRDTWRRNAEIDQNRKFLSNISRVADEMLEISSKCGTATESVGEGIAMTANAMKHTLGKFDVEILIPEVGAPVNKLSMESDEVGVRVKAVNQHGWTWRGEVLKKAQVQIDQ